MRAKLTKKLIDSLQAQAKDTIIWDTEVTGLGLKVSPTGRKSFLLKYRDLNNRQRKPKLGLFGDLTLVQGRAVARAWKAELSMGRDPSKTFKRSTATLTLNQFADEYFQRADKKQSTIDYEVSIFDKHIRTKLGSKVMSSIDKRDVQLWMNSLNRVSGGANRYLSLLRAVFNDAIRREQLSHDSNPCVGIAGYVNKPRRRYLSASELNRLWEALNDLKAESEVSIYVIELVRLALFTGARKSELLSLKWSYIDFKSRVVLLPDSKTGEREIFLSEIAVAGLEAIPKVTGNDFVFVGEKTGEHLKDPRRGFRKILDRAKVSDFRFHDLRHTHASWGAKSGLSLQLIAKTLGHSQARTSERYSHLDHEPALAAVNHISEKIQEAGLGEA